MVDLIILMKWPGFKLVLVSQAERLQKGSNTSVLRIKIVEGFVYKTGTRIKQMVHTRQKLFFSPEFLLTRRGFPFLAKFPEVSSRARAFKLVFGVVD